MTPAGSESSLELSPAQRAALSYVARCARERTADARARLTAILRSAGCSDELFERAIASIRAHARVVLHFHPDRIGAKPITVAESLLEDGCYRNQFETGLSSGSRTAFPDGERDRWERDLFGAAYHSARSNDEERPKYGALELVRHGDGPIPRFGSCYFVLHAAVGRRASFTACGSEQAGALERLGTLDAIDCVMAALLAEVASGEGARVPWPPFAAPTLGVAGLTVAGLLESLCRELPRSRPDPATRPAGRVLDTCVEAQVHGPVDLQRDVERLVIDPSFARTPTGEVLAAACRRYRIPSQWHCGYELSIDDVPGDFRGPAMPQLARRIAQHGRVDAAVIGAAESTLHSQPERWRDWGSREETLQHLKQLWHVVVHFGAPAARRPK